MLSLFKINNIVKGFSKPSPIEIDKLRLQTISKIQRLRTLQNQNCAPPYINTMKKSKDKMPKRPLSAYNIFFKIQRYLIINDRPAIRDICEIDQIREEIERAVSLGKTGPNKKKRSHRKTHGKIGFADLGKTIGIRWKTCSAEVKAYLEKIALEEKEKHYNAVGAHRRTGNDKSTSRTENCHGTAEMKGYGDSIDEPVPDCVQSFLNEKDRVPVLPNLGVDPCSAPSHPCKILDNRDESICNLHEHSIEPLPFQPDHTASTNLDEETCDYVVSTLGHL